MEEKSAEERFEDQLEGLEEVVRRLEDESVGLEEALDLFERGMELARRCRGRLEAVEQRVERLLSRADADGESEQTVPEEIELT